MGAVGADAPIKIVLVKKYTAIAPIEIRADMCIAPGTGMWTAPMMLNIFLRLCYVFDMTWWCTSLHIPPPPPFTMCTCDY